MPWLAQLNLQYTLTAQCTHVHFLHDGPLRVLRSLYPEGKGICHNVLVHPPGGLVGGDTLEVRVHVQQNAHALVTTPGATRFYKTNGAPTTQHTHLRLDSGAKLEWLPLETLAYSGCDAHNVLHLDVAEDAQLITWDITALGLPHAHEPFTAGRFTQHMQWSNIWLERAVIDAGDSMLLNSPLGLSGQRCIGSLLLASGSALTRAQREQLLETSRAIIDAHPWGHFVGVTAPNAHMVLVRGLAPVVEPLMQLWQQIRAAWRTNHWNLPATAPRIWNM